MHAQHLREVIDVGCVRHRLLPVELKDHCYSSLGVLFHRLMLQLLSDYGLCVDMFASIVSSAIERQ